MYTTVIDENDGRKRRKVVFDNDDHNNSDDVGNVKVKKMKSSDSSGIESDDNEYDFSDVDEDELNRKLSQTQNSKQLPETSTQGM